MILLASLNSALSGGLVAFDGSAMRFLDRVPTTGLDVANGALYRLVARRAWNGAELLIYDATGIREYHRLDELSDPHDVLVDEDGRIMCVSSLHDAILRLERNGSMSVVAGGDGIDQRHVNCLTLHEGSLYATAFGRGTSFREWKRPGKEADGVVFEAVSGRVVVDDLVQPHTPRWVDGAWLVCESARGTLVRAVEDGPRRSVEIGGFTRGLCVTDDAVFVGVSRNVNGSLDAEIVELDRETLTQRARHRLPGTSVYDIVAVDDALAAAAERAFATGTSRERATRRMSLFEAFGAVPDRVWPTGAFLARDDRRCTIEAALPASITAREAVIVDVSIRNRGGAILWTDIPAWVCLAHRWERRLDGHTVDVIAGAYPTPLPHPIPPGQSACLRALLVAPDDPATYELVLTLEHEGVEFDGDEHSALNARVRVDPRRIPTLVPGRRYAAAAGHDDVEAMFGAGWATPETTGVWSITSPAHLVFRVDADGSYALAVDVAGYRVAERDAAMRIEIDGAEVLVQTLPQLPARLLTSAAMLHAGRPIDVTLHVSNFFTPAEHGMPDARRLGLHLIGLTLVRER